MPMPFTPCDPALPTCPDVTIDILTKVFGPIITVLVKGQDPNTAAASASVLASMISYFNSGLLVVASLIVSYVAVMGAVNTANDGEAMGRSWSAFATPLRIVAGGAVLLPSASGYSFIQMMVLTISLWSVGFANGVYKVGMTLGMMKPDGMVASSYVSGTYYGTRQFAKDYLAIAYCKLAAKALYTDTAGTPNIDKAGWVADKKTVTAQKIDSTYYYMDRNTDTNLAGGDPVCGTISLSTYSALPNSAFTGDPSGMHQALDSLRVGLMQAKFQQTVALMQDLDVWVASWPLALQDPGWNSVDATRFNEIVKVREDQIGASISAQVTGATGSVKTGAQAFIDNQTLEGWAMAGGFYQRVGTLRTRLASLTSEPVGSATAPSLSGLPADSRAEQLRTAVLSITETILKKAETSGHGYEASTVINPSDIGSFIPKDVKSDFNVAAISDNIGAKLSLVINNAMQGITNTAIGSGTTVDAVTRMKLTGDAIATFRMQLWIAKTELITAMTAIRVAAGIANSVKVLGNGVDATGITTPLWDWVEQVPVKILDDIADYATSLAFYFSVLLPSLPYTIFMITVVGWVLAVFQSVIAAPLWAIMHMRPSQTFVGSDSQGYLLLLALFVRPALAVLGLFAAMLIADPIVDYIAKAFFAMRGDVVTSTGLLGALATFYTFFWWFTVFGALLLPVLYMIFGLPQILPDQVLKWIGGGLEDLGATGGSGMMQQSNGAAASAALANGRASMKLAGGKGKGASAAGDRQLDRAATAGSKPVNAGDQGVTNPGSTQALPAPSSSPAGGGRGGSGGGGGGPRAGRPSRPSGITGFNTRGGNPAGGGAAAATPAATASASSTPALPAPAPAAAPAAQASAGGGGGGGGAAGPDTALSQNAGNPPTNQA